MGKVSEKPSGLFGTGTCGFKVKNRRRALDLSSVELNGIIQTLLSLEANREMKPSVQGLNCSFPCFFSLSLFLFCFTTAFGFKNSFFNFSVPNLKRFHFIFEIKNKEIIF